MGIKALKNNFELIIQGECMLMGRASDDKIKWSPNATLEASIICYCCVRPMGSRVMPQSTLVAPEDQGGRSPEPQAWCDSSSEVSDEGYRSQGAPRPSPRTRRHQQGRLSASDSG